MFYFQDLRQVWTLYPDNPDNSFLGFTIEKSHHSHPHSQKKNQVVLYDAEGNYIIIMT